MLSNHIITNQKTVLVVDHVGLERFSDNFLQGWLQEQGQGNNIKRYTILPDVPSDECTKSFLNEIASLEQSTNVFAPTVSSFLAHHSPRDLFQFIATLKKSSNIKQTFLWASVKQIHEHFVVPFLEHMADLVVTIKDSQTLSILSKKAGGSVTNKLYKYTASVDQFLIEPLQKIQIKSEDPPVKPESLGTFKIELDEDELVARNALKLPYERTSEQQEGNIIYTPDADDDFDDEDPDEDLYI